ncbi:MAG TPA: hypothetical protein VJ984_06230 [Xanthomonadales bacterium]|nr:hypothetical protein [Xanthomonadales bacterium]
MRRLLIFLLIIAGFVGWNQWQYRPVKHEPGVLVPIKPVQRNLEQPAAFLFDGFTMTPRAEFDIQARILGRETYSWGDESDLSPIDLALGWGKMSDQAVLDQMSIRQGGRWYFTRYSLPPPIPENEIVRNSANMHMIPADPAIEKALKKLRPGEVIRIKGYLVDVDHDSGWKWRTSLTRTDTGQGACEIVFVEDVQRLIDS